MVNDAYIRGWCKTAEQYGVDPVALAKSAETIGRVPNGFTSAPWLSRIQGAAKREAHDYLRGIADKIQNHDMGAAEARADAKKALISLGRTARNTSQEEIASWLGAISRDIPRGIADEAGYHKAQIEREGIFPALRDYARNSKRDYINSIIRKQLGDADFDLSDSPANKAGVQPE